MKSLFTCLLVFTLSFNLLDCSKSKSKPQPNPGPVGDYEYTGYDKNRVKIVEGTLSVTSVESGEVKGRWNLRKVGNPETIGPQDGAGEFVGQMSEGNVTINLNPNMADNNVTLSGRIEGDRFAGTWTFSGFAGPMNEGTFEAQRK